MARCSNIAGMVFVSIACTTSILLAATPDVVRRGKLATAMVSLDGQRRLGAAFCIDSRGYYLTVAPLKTTAQYPHLTLILNAGEKNQQALKAKAVRYLARVHFSLLKTEPSKHHTPLTLGDSDSLLETMRVVSFGYPRAPNNSPQENQINTITVRIARVSSLHKRQGTIDKIQIDKIVDRGEMGAPVLNDKGQVVGVVQMLVKGSGGTLLYPTRPLKTFLSEPFVHVTAPKVKFQDRRLPAKFEIDVVRVFKEDTLKETVELEIGKGDNRRTVIAAREKSGRYTASLSPFTKRKETPRLTASVKFAGGAITGEMDDQTISLGDKSFKLSQLNGIVRDGDSYTVKPRNGDSSKGLRLQPDKMTVRAGGVALTFDTSRIVDMTGLNPVNNASDCERIHPGRSPERIFSDVSKTLRC
jgi:hypothetical protein